MPVKKKQPRKPKKRGPEPEVLKIEGDAIEAFDKMVAHEPKPAPKKKAKRKK